MGLLQRLLGRPKQRQGRGSTRNQTPKAADSTAGIPFHVLGRRLLSTRSEVREEAALLTAGLVPDELMRPLVRAYLRHADHALLPVARAYGARLTAIIAREATDTAHSPTQRARLIELLGATADPAAVRLLREAARDLEPAPRIAASAALADLGDRHALDTLQDELVVTDASRRALALAAVSGLSSPEGRAMAARHALRYLAEGGAIPVSIGVSLPLLIDRDADLAELLVRHAAAATTGLTLLCGPATGILSEHWRNDFLHGLARHHLLFTTHRHEMPERLEILELACAMASADAIDRPVTLIGPLPDPGDAYPSPQLLSVPGPTRFQVRVVYAGPTKVDPVLAWWQYLDTVAPVIGTLQVVLTSLTLGGGRLTDEELSIQRIVDEQDLGELPDPFARAYFARLQEVRA